MHHDARGRDGGVREVMAAGIVGVSTVRYAATEWAWLGFCKCSDLARAASLSVRWSLRCSWQQGQQWQSHRIWKVPCIIPTVTVETRSDAALFHTHRATSG